MNRSRLIFLVIVGLALAVVLVGVVMDRMGDSDSGGSNQSENRGPIRFTVAVNPLAEKWIRSAAQSFNNQRRQVDGRVIEISLDVQDSLPLWSSPGQWSLANHPLVWIPEMSPAVEWANQTGLRYSVLQPSLASTVMLWGAPADRAVVIQNEYGGLNWMSVQQVSVDGWGQTGVQAGWGRFPKPGFAQPDRYTSGLAAMLIAVAEFNQQAALDGSQFDNQALTNWLRPVIANVPGFATLGAHPAESIATRGTSVADIALLPESEWLVNYRSLTTKVNGLTFAYPAYQFWFDFPFAVWDDDEVPAQDRAAAQNFLNFLLSSDQQRQAASFGLRQADGTPAAAALFQAAESAGVSAIRPSGDPLQLPSRSDMLSFVNRNWTAF